MEPRFWTTWLAILAGLILSILPIRLRSGIGELMTRLLCLKHTKHRRIAAINLSLCYPQLTNNERDQLLNQNSRVFSHMILGYGQLLFRSPHHLSQQFDIRGMDIVERAISSGSNIILLTPHSLALEYAAQYLSQHHAMVGIARIHSNNDVMDWIVTKARTRYNGTIYDGAERMQHVVNAVRSGKWLYYLPDEDRGTNNSIFIPFYGIQKATISTLGRLTRCCRATVIPMMTAYSPQLHRFTIKFHKPINNFPSNNTYLDILRMNKAIEGILDDDPAQYMWSSKIFRTRPNGDADSYKLADSQKHIAHLRRNNNGSNSLFGDNKS